MAEKQQNSIQIDILGNIYNNIREGLAKGKDLIMLQGSARCFAPGTKVRMYDGTLKNVEDVDYFDKVANVDGSSYNTVIDKHKGRDLMYKVTYSDGTYYIINSQHELVLIGQYDVEYHIPVNKYIDLLATDERYKSLKGCVMFNGAKHLRNITVEEIGFGEYYGFTLTGDHLFLLEDGTIVKNSGKTYNTLIWIILECLQRPIREREVKDPSTGRMLTKKEPLRVSIVRNSLPVIKRSVYEDFKTIMINMGQWDDRRMNRTDYIYTFPNGATIEFFSAEDEQKLRGPWRHILYINEANEIYYYSFSMLRQRTYEYTIVDYNPSFTEEHWLFPLMKDERSYHFISTYKDNIFLPAPAIREIESYQTTNPALWQIFGKGEFAIVEGLVFPKENWDIIEDDAYPSWLGEELIGIDWGFTCLTGNTLISTTEGYKRIDQIEVGDVVYNSNGKNKVLKVHKNGTQEVWDFEIRTNCGNIFISATPTHKIKVFPNYPGASHYYSEDCTISELEPLDCVMLDNGRGHNNKAYILEIIIHEKYQAEVFDLTIENKHEYFANNILVHNCDPTTFVGVIINGEDIYVRELHYQTGMKTKDIAEALEPYAGNYKYCDIDNRLVSELEDAGIPLLTMTKKNSESIMSGIRLMNQRKIHVTTSSNDLIKELRNYVYKKDRHETYQTNVKPIDKFNHCFDYQTLIATNEGYKCIGEIEVGDMVYNSKGLFPVQKVFKNGVQEIWDVIIEYENGAKTELSVTPNHKIKTNYGWKQLQELTKGDMVYLLKSSMEKHIISIGEKSTSQKVQNFYTELYGSTIMDLYQKGIISTIKMRIHGIILSKILSAYLAVITCLCTFRKKCKILLSWKNLGSEWATQEYMRASGTVAKKGLNGIKSTGKESQKTYNQENTHAYIVERNSGKSHSEKSNSALITVNQLGEESKAMTMKQEFASTAVKNLQQTNTASQNIVEEVVVKNIHIKSKRNAETYNLMIADVHEYIAHNLLVLNCIDALRYVIYAECGGINGDDIINDRPLTKEELGIFM